MDSNQSCGNSTYQSLIPCFTSLFQGFKFPRSRFSRYSPRFSSFSQTMKEIVKYHHSVHVQDRTESQILSYSRHLKTVLPGSLHRMTIENTILVFSPPFHAPLSAVTQPDDTKTMKTRVEEQHDILDFLPIFSDVFFIANSVHPLLIVISDKSFPPFGATFPFLRFRRNLTK